MSTPEPGAPGAQPPTDQHWADDAHRYALSSRIATGGMGEVWRGRDTVLDRPVAVKLLKAEYADDALFRRRFESEARHAASLHHPGIAGVFDFGEASPLHGPDDASGTPRPYLVMELVEGQPLSALLRPSAPMDPDVARDLLAQTADALGAAHRAGIVHRDVKPGNLIVTPDRRIKVTDFGIARAAEGMALTETGQVMGTPAYISPEQAEGGRATSASDVYSLGVVAFECLAGRRPFVAETPVATAVAHLRQPVPDLPDSIPADLAAVVKRALAKTPEERYADGSAFAAALRSPAAAAAARPAAATVVPATPVVPAAATQVLPVTSTRDTTPPPAATPAATPTRRRTNWLPWALLAAVLVVGALIIWQLMSDTGDTAARPSDGQTPSESTRSQTESPSEPTQEPTTEPTEEPTAEDIEVDEADFLGADIKEVEDALRDLGLKVSKDKLDNPGDEVEDTVAGVNPSGTLAEGDSVTVSYWGKVTGKPVETPVEPAPSETPTDPAPTDPAPTQ